MIPSLKLSLLFILSFALIQCDDADFKGANAAEKERSPQGEGPVVGNPPTDPNDPPTGPEQPPSGNNPPSNILENNECRISGDLVKINFSPEIEQCYDNNRIFNFASEPIQCSSVIKSSFRCDWNTVKDVVKNVSPLNVNYVEALASRGAKLISCGQTNQGKTILIQWWESKTTSQAGASCEVNRNTKIGTDCFEAGSIQGDNQNKNRVNNCFNK